jgi:hypothetical protein
MTVQSRTADGIYRAKAQRQVKKVQETTDCSGNVRLNVVRKLGDLIIVNGEVNPSMESPPREGCGGGQSFLTRHKHTA